MGHNNGKCCCNCTLLFLVYFGGEKPQYYGAEHFSVTNDTNQNKDRRGRELTRIEDNKQGNSRGEQSGSVRVMQVSGC